VLRTSDLEYDLPPDRIATVAASPRDSARLLVTERAGTRLEDLHVRDLPDVLRAGDLLVFNATRVLPARLIGRREGTGGKIEGLFLASVPGGGWVCLLKAGSLRSGIEVRLDGPDGSPSNILLVLRERSTEEGGAWIVDVRGGSGSVVADLQAVGRTPLPPYIIKARQGGGIAVDDREDRGRYQTVFAGHAERNDGASMAGEQGGVVGSVAAPTAGLHFTPELLARLKDRGVERAEVVLHVGTGTFRPVEAEFVEEHTMHEEWCSVPGATCEAIRRARAEQRRVIAVGTTSARAIESYGQREAAGEALPASLATRILITPGYRWRWCTGMMTNFHLPRSTLLAMVGSMYEGGVGRAIEVYQHALARGYRFYSYGDSMLILP
jgi:S-adenosylmethionine:tRNA ribosyltransferase-isomerase